MKNQWLGSKTENSMDQYMMYNLGIRYILSLLQRRPWKYSGKDHSWHFSPLLLRSRLKNRSLGSITPEWRRPPKEFGGSHQVTKNWSWNLLGIMSNELTVVMDIMWKVVVLVVIATTITGVKATPGNYNITGIYQCQEKGYDSYSHMALGKMWGVMNASMWERTDTWGCECAFVQDGFHEAHHPPMKLIQISPGCCDKCLTSVLSLDSKSKSVQQNGLILTLTSLR